jgi:hypothetical protein
VPDEISLPKPGLAGNASPIGLVALRNFLGIAQENKSSPAASLAEAPFTLLHRLPPPSPLSLLLSLFIDFVDILSFHSSVIDAEIERDLR